MPRMSKNTEERRNELLNAAEELFITKGYNETAVSDIVKKISVAQGTFYYYFKSKDEIFVALFDRQLKNSIEKLDYKINNSCTTALEKLKEFIKSDIENKILNRHDPLVKHLHEEQNAGLHQKVTVAAILNHKQILSKIIFEGIEEGQFKTSYPDEVSELFLTNSRFGFDPSIFTLEEEYPKKFMALLDFLEKVLSLPKGSLDIKDFIVPYLT
jgi:AcrR family transcriptional regulator